MISSAKNPGATCPACGQVTVPRLAYRGPLRNGRWGTWTQAEHEVLECHLCGMQWLKSDAEASRFYESSEYHEAYGLEAGEAGLQYLRGNASKEFGDKIVVDIGAGNGAFLQSIASFCRETIAVEPSEAIRRSIQSSHQKFASLTELAALGKRADVATTFNVIEHVADPFAFLKEIASCLKPGGKLWLVTPNTDDIGLRASPAPFSRYFYRSAHKFYFRTRSLEAVLARAGFHSIRFEFRHRYGLENLLGWLTEGQPPGGKQAAFDTAAVNEIYRQEIERQGFSSHLLASATASNE
jgi:SAM-dependent methyltransferase